VVSRSSRPGAGLFDGFGGKIWHIRWKFPEDYRDPLGAGRNARAPCSLGAVSDIVSENYAKLASLLRDREGWHPETQDGERFWRFGLHGAGRLVITSEMDGFLMYRVDHDDSWVIPRIESVEAWLEEHEHEHAGLTDSPYHPPKKQRLASRPGHGV
jgi:hypothetical protein